MNNQPLVSIVTPAYNEEKNIAECLDSILAQTYQHWECIVANNCSVDATGDIARRYSAKDCRIKVFDNESLLPANRNFNQALQRISPEAAYCKVVFADDWIFPECIEKMVALAEANPSVGIVGAYALQDRDVAWTGLPYPSTCIPGREICRNRFLDRQSVFGTATTVLYRADLVHGNAAFFNESNIHADSEKCCELLRNCDFGFINQVLTFTRVREGSMFAFSSNMGTFVAGNLRELTAYGRDFLTPEEFDACLERLLRHYYDFLARSVIHRRGSEFWDYHKRRLAEAGVGFERVRLFKAVAREALGAVANPGSTIARLVGSRPARDSAGRNPATEQA